MYYPRRRIPLEWFALLTAVALLLLAIMYTSPTPALASGYTRVRVLSASASQGSVDLVFWTGSDFNLSITGDINAPVGALPPGVHSLHLPVAPRNGVLRICFDTASFRDCGVIRPLLVS